MTLLEAVKFTQESRPTIDPLAKVKGEEGPLSKLLHAYENGLKKDSQYKFMTKYNPVMEQIHI